jgi:hypothetical protein
MNPDDLAGLEKAAYRESAEHAAAGGRKNGGGKEKREC